jgi:hypothetical protein
MAGRSGFSGLRRRDRTAGPRSDWPTSGGQPVPGTPGGPTTAVSSEWQWSGSLPGAGLTGAQHTSGVVIHARRAGDVDPMPQPSFSA